MKIEYLGDATVSAGDRQLVWLNGVYGRPFTAEPDDLAGGLDRLVAIATTDLGANLAWLQSPLTVQEVVDRARSLRGARRRRKRRLAGRNSSGWPKCVRCALLHDAVSAASMRRRGLDGVRDRLSLRVDQLLQLHVRQ